MTKTSKGSKNARLMLASLAVTFPILVSGCGTYVPPMQEFWEGTQPSAVVTAGGALEYKIKQKVYCSIVDAANAARAADLLPTHWSAQITLDLQVDETGALNPSVAYLNPMSAMQSFSLGAGANLSSQATHEDKFGSYWNLDKLNGIVGNACDLANYNDHGSSLLLASDLKIKEWLLDALANENALPSSNLTKGESYFKQDFLSYHLRFLVTSGGGLTPTWKLTRVTSGTGSLPLVSGNRARTHDLLITFGPTFSKNGLNLAISSHQAQEFGIAVSNGTRQPLIPNATIFSPF
jgi:hypothetical protein